MTASLCIDCYWHKFLNTQIEPSRKPAFEMEFPNVISKVRFEWNFPMYVVNLCRITNRRVTTNGCPFRKHTPYCGWVTLAMAGFLASGSNALALPSQFPSGFVKQSLTAYSCEGSQGFRRSNSPLLVPYCFP